MGFIIIYCYTGFTRNNKNNNNNNNNNNQSLFKVLNKRSNLQNGSLIKIQLSNC